MQPSPESPELEDDPIVKEIDLYLSSELSSHLYLFQFPVRNRPYQGDSAPVAMKMKPKAGVVELDMPLDSKAPTYNRDRGEELALGLNDSTLRTVYDHHNDHDPSSQSLMNRFTLRSSSIPKTTNYFIGVMRSGIDELHLTPLEGIRQLRPSFLHLDMIDEKKKAATKRVEEEENPKEEKSVEEYSAVQLQLKKVSANAAPVKVSNRTLQKQEEEEPWTPFQLFDTLSNEANIIYDKMFAVQREPLEVEVSAAGYMKDLCA